MKRFDREDAYYKAKHRVDQIRNFYVHLAVYIVVNLGISILKLSRNFANGETFNEAFFDLGTFFIWGVWGIGLALHAFSVYGFPLLFGKNWEQDKLEQFMQEELQDTDKK